MGIYRHLRGGQTREDFVGSDAGAGGAAGDSADEGSQLLPHRPREAGGAAVGRHQGRAGVEFHVRLVN